MTELFIEELEERVEIAKDARSIFRKIREEEDKKINKLFSEESRPIKYFKKITNGNYVNINYDESSEEIVVVKENGNKVRTLKLSQGTYDQLYMSIRLSLAENVLQGEPGFLILDDPFLSYDSNRIKNVMEIMQDLSEKGWEIVLFTAKDDIKDAFKKIAGEKPEKLPVKL